MSADTTTPAAEAFEGWVVVHLFGRHTVAGRASEQKIAGKDYLRLDIPEVDGRQARTLFYSPDAVYDLEPVDEETARMVVAMHRPAEPVTAWTARRMLEDAGGEQLALVVSPPEEYDPDPQDDDEDEELYAPPSTRPPF
jgi:hypothetical protein